MRVMNENERELESNATSLKHRIERTMLLGGFILISISFMLISIRSVMFYALILTGAEFQVTGADYYIESLFFLLGIVTIIAGLIIYGTSLFSKDGLWVLQTGPYVR